MIDGIELKLCFEKGQWILKYGTEKVITIVELSSIVDFLINENKIEKFKENDIYRYNLK